MIPEPSNKFGRRRDELPTAEELLSAINKPMPHAMESEQQVVASWMKWPATLEDPGISVDAFRDDGLQSIARELLTLQEQKKPLFFNGEFDTALFIGHLKARGLYDRLHLPTMEALGIIPLPTHYPWHCKIVQNAYRRRRMIQVLALGIDGLQRFGQLEGQTLEDLTSEVHQRLSDIETEDDAADLPSRPIGKIVLEVIEKAQERRCNPGRIPGISTGFPALDKLTGGLQPGRLWAILAESSNGKSLMGRQMVEEGCSQGHMGVIYTYEMMDDEEVARMLCSQGRITSDSLMLGNLRANEMGAFKRAADTVQGWKVAVVDVAGKFIEDILRDIKRRSRRLAEGQHLIAMIDYPQIAKCRKKCSNREQEVAFITGEIKLCAKRCQRTTIIVPSQVNKDGDARESMAIEQDADVKIQIVNPNQKRDGKGGKLKAWEQEQPAQQDLTPEEIVQQSRRRLYIGKNRGGKKGESIKVIMKGEIFRFEPDY